MPTGYQIKDQTQSHYLTLQVVYWVDVFTRRAYRDIVVESLRHCQQHKALDIFAYVIMSNHVHLLVRSGSGDLSGTIRDFKKFTSKAIIEAIKAGPESRREWMLRLFTHAAKRQNKQGEYQFWTHENHAEVIYSPEFIAQKAAYIHNNPVRARLVELPEEYLYSSARNYAGRESLLDIIRVDQ
ncbi:MAG: transposase, partial [Rikenellaceae bacterium]|jgi:REP element-mobilizing transposase RayT|nr:transposase [Rikenellaceae bacterium]